jgi:hydroxypyruvate reductase
VVNLIVGNNAVAVDASGLEAERRGYAHAMIAASTLEGPAEEVGHHLADMALRMRNEDGPDCLITGGEPVVQLVPPDQRGLGGRNQQLVLAGLVRLLDGVEGTSAADGKQPPNPLDQMVLLSGGTDGEDGPTDAAGALVDAGVVSAMYEQALRPHDFLRRNDAYHFFEPLDGLIKTGPTHTNVCDVRVVVVGRE